MINQMSVEKLSMNIFKRAVRAAVSPLDEDNVRNIHEDFKELADRLGYRVEKVPANV